MKACRIAWTIVGLLSLCTAARAGPVTWGFEGTVTLVDDRNGVLGGAVEVGSAFSGTYTFESETPGNGLFEDAITQIAGHIGTITFTQLPGRTNQIRVLNNYSPLAFDHYALDADVELEGIAMRFQLDLRDFSGLMFSTFELPLTPPSLDGIDITFSGLHLGESSETLSINGELLSIFVVPEPTSLLLIAIGLALNLRRKRGA